MRALALSGMTMIVVTHEMAFAREVGDTLAVMVDGQIIGDRSQGRHDGTHLDQRHTELSRWLATGERVGAG